MQDLFKIYSISIQDQFKIRQISIQYQSIQVHASGNGETVLTTFGPQDDLAMSGRGTT